MANDQRPLGSGFGPRSTADEVLAGCDLTGRLAVVTGGHSGLGLATTRALARAGAAVIVGARDPAAAAPALAGLPGVAVAALDLADLASVRAFADRLVASGRRVALLVNNAGIMACPETRVGPGWEAQFAVNHLGHFTLACGLWPALRGGARVVAVSSAGHHASPIRWDDLHVAQGYDKWRTYGQSKTANALFALHLDRIGRAEGVRAFSLHPGKILTPLQRHLGRAEMVAQGWIHPDGRLADPTFKSPEQGAATQVWAATASRLDGLGGLYCEDCDVAPRAGEAGAPFAGVCDHAADPGEAERLWAVSADLTGTDIPAGG
ncbi:SDR family NAD(P)-dependent oxidoreductase [Methylobacterium sp. JK268]